MTAARRKQIVTWLSRGKPRWTCRKTADPHPYHHLCLSGDQGVLLDDVAATVSYDEEYKGWTATYDDGETGVMCDDGENFALFDSADEAKSAVMEELPAHIEIRLRDMAQLAVDEIYNEMGFWTPILFPCGGGRTRAVKYLVDQYFMRKSTACTSSSRAAQRRGT